jgi:hypothetical protein
MEKHEILSLQGVQKDLTIDGNKVIIHQRKAFLQAENEKTLPISRLGSVQIKKPSLMWRGYIQFSIGGGKEKNQSLSWTGGAFDAANDENAVLFDGDYNYEMLLKSRSTLKITLSHSSQQIRLRMKLRNTSSLRMKGLYLKRSSSKRRINFWEYEVNYGNIKITSNTQFRFVNWTTLMWNIYYCMRLLYILFCRVMVRYYHDSFRSDFCDCWSKINWNK